MVPGTTTIIETAPVRRSLTLMRRRPCLVPNVAGATVEFGAALRRQCAELANAFGSVNGIALSCETERAEIAETLAAELALIALGLIASASTSFADRRHGRIGVSFRADAGELELTVEHSGPGTEAARSRTSEAARLEQRLVARLGGRVDCPRMIGGVRVVVTVPRPAPGTG